MVVVVVVVAFNAPSIYNLKLLEFFQAMAEMLEFWRSLLRQSNPSTLTVAGLGPNVILAQPPLRAEEDGEDKPEPGGGNGIAGKGATTSPNRASWTKGLAALLGGDPLKNGGDEATSFM